MPKPFAMVSGVCQHVVDLADEQVLAVIKARDFITCGRESLSFQGTSDLSGRFCVSPTTLKVSESMNGGTTTS